MHPPCLDFFFWLLTFSTTGTLSLHPHPVPLHLRRLCPHHGVRQLDGHPGGHPEKVPLPPLLHLVLLQSFHHPPLAGHGASLWRHPCVLRCAQAFEREQRSNQRKDFLVAASYCNKAASFFKRALNVQEND